MEKSEGHQFQTVRQGSFCRMVKSKPLRKLLTKRNLIECGKPADGCEGEIEAGARAA